MLDKIKYGLGKIIISCIESMDFFISSIILGMGFSIGFILLYLL